jgi:hypothetical protein
MGKLESTMEAIPKIVNWKIEVEFNGTDSDSKK